MAEQQQHAEHNIFELFLLFVVFSFCCPTPASKWETVVTPSAVSRTRLNQTNTCENAEHWIIVFRT